VKHAHATWFHMSSRPFASNTRDLALELNAKFGWTEDRFKAAKEQLIAACAAMGNFSNAFQGD
jgi:hypothetical protein